MQIEQHKDFLILTLDHPQTKNAFGLAEARILQKVMKQKARGIILKAQGSVFCSGGNLDDYSKMKTKSQGLKVNAEISQTLSRFAQWPGARLAVVEGDCLGGGVELISCCHWIVATPVCYFALWQRRMGLSFGWGGYNRLAQRMSPATVQAWSLSSDVKSAYWCLQNGLLDELISPHDVENYMQNWMDKEARQERVSLSKIQSLDSKREAKFFADLWWSPFHRQRLRQFIKK